MTRRDIEGCRAVVTGASSGIGREIALELAHHRVRQILVARRHDQLSAVTSQVKSLGGDAHIVIGDTSNPELRQQLLECIDQQLGSVDILINNAAIGGIGPFANADSARLRNLVEVNFIAPLELIRLVLPRLEKSEAPVIVNVGSVLGYIAVPGKSEYCATKFALRGFSDALRAELAPQGIGVLYVAPSTTRTEFFDKASGQTGLVKFNRWNSTTAKTVARRTVQAIQRGKNEAIISLGGKALVGMHRLLPAVTRKVAAQFARNVDS